MDSLRNSDRVVIVLHGGLGNQLFQLFAGLCVAGGDGSKISCHVGALRRYDVPRDPEIGPLLEANALRELSYLTRLVARSRLPKLLKRICGRELVVPIPSIGRVVDGYFQDAGFYSNFEQKMLLGILDEWRRVVGPEQRLANDGLLHLRLRDFFTSTDATRAFVESRLVNTTPLTVMTDDDAIVQDVMNVDQPRSRDIRLFKTASMNAWDVFAAMRRFSHITSNGSTLAFWASVLSGASLETPSEQQRTLKKMLSPAE